MNNELGSELLRRSAIDQVMRNAVIESGDISLWDDELDKQNTNYLEKIVNEDGWPTISKVGEEASQAAWLLAQHADHDLEFQAKCLALMKSLPLDEVQQANIAYLEDRVLVAQGKSQLYGTQFYTEGGQLRPRPIQNEEELDARRTVMELGTFADYSQIMMGHYGN